MHHLAGSVSSSGYYLHWGVIQISLTNFLIILGMVLLFAVAVLVPFPGSRDYDQAEAARVEDKRDAED